MGRHTAPRGDGERRHRGPRRLGDPGSRYRLAGRPACSATARSHDLPAGSGGRSRSLRASALGSRDGLLLPRPQTYATQVGEQRSIALNDGSTVELDTRSRIRVRLERDARKIELLEGQALFHVAKDERRPFIVSCDEVRVRASVRSSMCTARRRA